MVKTPLDREAGSTITRSADPSRVRWISGGSPRNALGHNAGTRPACGAHAVGVRTKQPTYCALRRPIAGRPQTSPDRPMPSQVGATDKKTSCRAFFCRVEPQGPPPTTSASAHRRMVDGGLGGQADPPSDIPAGGWPGIERTPHGIPGALCPPASVTRRHPAPHEAARLKPPCRALWCLPFPPAQVAELADAPA